MTTSVPFSALLAPKRNPRTVYDKRSIEGLAQSIKKDGVIQNLLVRPEGEGTYRVVAGKRRYLALQHLSRKGEIDRAYKVPVLIKTKSTGKDLHRIATVENVQREALDPIDEAEAFAKLLGKGAKIEDISVETGVSVPTIHRRLALAGLASEVKAAVRAKTVTLSLAEVLTLAPPEHQKALLKELNRNRHIDARQLRGMLLAEKPSLAWAVFPLEQYTGTFTRDLFAEKKTTYFDDREQFVKLQEQAVAAMAEDLRSKLAWVEVATEHQVPWWQYREAKKKEAAGAIIHFAPTGRVEVRKGLVRNPVDPEVATTRKRKEKPKERPAYSKTTLRYVNSHMTVALQMAILKEARTAKEVVALLLLTDEARSRIRLSPHDALKEVAQEPTCSKAYAALEEMAGTLLQSLGLTPKGERPSWLMIFHTGASWRDLAPAIRNLPDAELDLLISLPILLTFGVSNLEVAEGADSAFGQVSGQVPLSLRAVWTPDATFLKGLRREDLAKVTAECGALRKQPRLGQASKAQLVDGLAAYFVRTAMPDAVLDEHEAKGRTWLPSIMTLATDANRP